MAELKRILLLRIADLEFVGAAVEKAANREETGPPATVPQGVVAQDDVIQLPILDDPEAA